MIVLDASVVVDLLIGGPSSDFVRQDPALCQEAILTPHLLDVEVVNAIRSLVAGRRMPREHGEQIIQALDELPAQRCPHTPLLGRVWELRNNFTAYDAVYVALAETTGAVLYTKDRKLAKGHRARVKVVG